MARVRVRDGGPRPSAGPTDSGRSRLVEPWTDRPRDAAPRSRPRGAAGARASGARQPVRDRAGATIALRPAPVHAPAAAPGRTAARAAGTRGLRAPVPAPQRVPALLH